jgi:hypothetical protein
MEPILRRHQPPARSRLRLHADRVLPAVHRARRAVSAESDFATVVCQ